MSPLSRSVAFALPLALVVGCGASPGGGASHVDATGREPIRFERHVSAGLHWIDVVHHAEQSAQVTRADGNVVESESETMTVDLEARMTVLQAGADGDVTQMRVEVRRFAATRSSGAPSPTLPPVLIVERGEPGTIRGEGGETFDEETLEVLGKVLPTTHRAGGPGDRVFGSETPRAPGETWALDKTPIAESMSTETFHVAAADLSGTSTFVERTTVQGIECLVLRARIDAARVAMPGMPPGTEVRRATMEFNAEGTMPRDTSLPMLRERIGFVARIEVAAQTPGEPAVLVDIDTVEQTTHERTLD